MPVNHLYGLDWLDQEALYRVTRDSFKSALQSDTAKKWPPDPFLLLAHGCLGGLGLAKARMFESERRLNKTLSNNIGVWHQRVLGLADNWQETGVTGGSIDLRTVPGFLHPKFNKPVYVEVKNRFNTIKASDEKNLWDRLDSLARSNDGIAYVFQIVPKTPERYDKPWKVSGRDARDNIRVCDGVTGYSLVFDRPDALQEIFFALPKILSEVTGKDLTVSEEELADLFSASLPRD